MLLQLYQTITLKSINGNWNVRNESLRPNYFFFTIMEIIAVLTTFLPEQPILKTIAKYPEYLDIYSQQIRRKHKKNPKCLI